MADRTKREPRKSGSIKRKGAGVFLVSVYLGRDPLTGKRRYVAKQIRGKKRDAQTYLNQALREIDAGKFAPPTSLTVDEFLNRWLESVARPRVSARTADGYAALLQRYVRPAIGQRRLDGLRSFDIQEVYGNMQKRGLSARVVRHTHSAFKSALGQAVKWGIISSNPADYVELPKVPHKERRVLTPDEAGSFLEAAADMPHGLIFEFALLSGMRPKNTLPYSGRILILISHATLLLAQNEHPKIVSERLGHSSITLTLDTYSHVLPTMQEATTQKLESLLYGKKNDDKKAAV